MVASRVRNGSGLSECPVRADQCEGKCFLKYRCHTRSPIAGSYSTE